MKALVYFTVPAFGLRKLHIPSAERPHLFVIPDLVLLALAAALGYHLIYVRLLRITGTYAYAGKR